MDKYNRVISNAEFTLGKQFKNTDEMLFQYLDLIFDLIEEVMSLSEKRDELMQKY